MSEEFLFPDRLERVRQNLVAQREALLRVARVFADTLAAGGVVHVYANGHSRIAVEELCVRMGAITGFRALLQVGLTTFTDVVGANGIRVNQALERCEGIAAAMLDEVRVGPGEPLLVVTATGQTPAAVDMASEWVRRFPRHPIVGLCCVEQSRRAPPKHSSGRNLSHVVESSPQGILLDNGMPYGDLSVDVEGASGRYQLCPLSSIGALAVIQSLNELVVRELDRRAVKPCVLQNMHTGATQPNYDEWLRDQRTRYARATSPGETAPEREAAP